MYNLKLIILFNNEKSKTIDYCNTLGSARNLSPSNVVVTSVSFSKSSLGMYLKCL